MRKTTGTKLVNVDDNSRLDWGVLELREHRRLVTRKGDSRCRFIWASGEQCPFKAAVIGGLRCGYHRGKKSVGHDR